MKNLSSSKRIAQGCCCYSKRADQFIPGVYPEYVIDNDYTMDDGCGEMPPDKSWVGSDGKCYLDLSGGLGSNINGWENNYSLPSILEPRLAERLHKIFPFMDSMRFLKTGSDATEAAIRVARTKKHGFVFGSGYHGWHNIFIAAETPGSGTRQEGYGKKEELGQIVDIIEGYHAENISAVIIEPVMLDLSVRPLLKRLRAACTKHNVCLIFDEIITGFRVPKYSFSNWWGITPDIICLGKALANGYPLAVMGGSAEYMDAPGYFISNTHAGEEMSLKAAHDVLDWMTPAKLEELWRRGGWFFGELSKILNQIDVRLIGYNTRMTWAGNDANKAKFWQEMLGRGYFFGKAFFLNFRHTRPILREVLKAARAIVKDIRDGKVTLKGELPKEAFKR